jgi:hypothetical protein
VDAEVGEVGAGVMVPTSLDTAAVNTERNELVDITDMVDSKTRMFTGALVVCAAAGSTRSKTGLNASQIGGVVI